MEFYKRVRFVLRVCCHMITSVTFHWILPTGLLVHILIACMSGLYFRSTAKVIYGREKQRKKEKPGLQLCSAIDFQSTLDPKFLETPTNKTYIRGELAILYCSVQNLGTKTVIWRRTSEPNPLTIGTTAFDPDPRYSVNHVQYREQWNLYIKNVSMSDAGLYECQVSSRQRNIRRVILLRVTEPPTTSPRPVPTKPIRLTGDRFVTVGNPIVLNCNATSSETGTYATSNVDWFKDGKKISSNNKHIKITKYTNDRIKHSVLEIANAYSEDAGEYVCRTSKLQVTNIHVDVLSEQEMEMFRDDPNFAKTKNEKRGTDERVSTESINQAASNISRLFFVLISSLLISLLFNIQIR